MSAEISVVVPVYNTEEYLEQCLDSIVNQTFKDIEIICVDDGSTDKSMDILEMYAKGDSRIKVVHRNECSGSGAVPRNTGMDMATGRYIMFLDSDDYFDLEMLEKLHDCAVTEGVEMVACNNYCFDDNGISAEPSFSCLYHERIEKVLGRAFSYSDIPDDIFQITGVVVWNKLILRDVLVRNSIRAQENIPINDDVGFVFELMINLRSIYILEEQLVYYRFWREQSQTAVLSEDRIMKCLGVCSWVYNSVKKAGAYEEVKACLYNEIIVFSCHWYMLIDNSKTGKRFYESAKDIINRLFKDDGITGSDITKYNISFYDYMEDGTFKPSINMLLHENLDNPLKLVLYGAGHDGKKLYERIANENVHKIVLWVDRNAADMEDERVLEPAAIKGCDYDAVLISIANGFIVRDVKRCLHELGVDESDIYCI